MSVDRGVKGCPVGRSGDRVEGWVEVGGVPEESGGVRVWSPPRRSRSTQVCPEMTLRTEKPLRLRLTYPRPVVDRAYGRTNPEWRFSSHRPSMARKVTSSFWYRSHRCSMKKKSTPYYRTLRGWCSHWTLSRTVTGAGVSVLR